MESYVLDTSLFTNPDVYAQFADEPHGAITAFVALAPRAHARFYMPISVYEELGRMRDLAEVAADFETVVYIRSPRRFGMQLPSEILYEFIEEVRERINRGLRIAEEHMRLAGRSVDAGDAERLMHHLRERYREALRKGIVDSREDADVLLLAYEVDGVVVSADEGLLRWADRLGVKIIDPRHFRRILENRIEHFAP
ncbi:RNA ligase partner protein [Inmirania thermothiophila]|uniref:RNA-free ribonuclease P n=1 Tax=Inmirania thermothiophila TaxID=1750597 RepID=A0A3N1Y774_9GAMM|nr:RNA ligase partner protein [Inmirania thermothiophila]ROR34600.1 hypothetical protein EDC57_0499 [Inmirania thermothiophila]